MSIKLLRFSLTKVKPSTKCLSYFSFTSKISPLHVIGLKSFTKTFNCDFWSCLRPGKVDRCTDITYWRSYSTVEMKMQTKM